MSPEHHALALTGPRLSELAPTLITEFQGNAIRRFAWRPKDRNFYLLIAQVNTHGVRSR